MAYTVTWTLTRPDEETTIPTIDSVSGTNKSASEAILASHGVSKTYQVDGLTTRVIYEATDKATYDAARAEIDSSVSDEATVKSQLKTQMESAGITVTVDDSEGTNITSF
tara:strand:- start:3672 stop:4001 length:330 start_codon:yes stop_codon:yes gene_type:complete